jgi:hypothetical protein
VSAGGRATLGPPLSPILLGSAPWTHGALLLHVDFEHVRLVYQPPANSTFLSEQTSHQPPASSTFLSEQTSTSHQPLTGGRAGAGILVMAIPCVLLALHGSTRFCLLGVCLCLDRLQQYNAKSGRHLWVCLAHSVCLSIANVLVSNRHGKILCYSLSSDTPCPCSFCSARDGEKQVPVRRSTSPRRPGRAPPRPRTWWRRSGSSSPTHAGEELDGSTRPRRQSSIRCGGALIDGGAC